MRIAAILLVLVATACGKGGGSAHSREVCEKAADRWETCALEMLGPEMAKEAGAKRDIGACARDGKTVAMYEKCLPSVSCGELMDCMMGEVGAAP
jgi:hypothetical protein